MILPLGFFTVFTLPAILIALAGGAATGWVLGHMFPPNPLVRSHRVALAFGVIGFIGLIFFAGQTVEVALSTASELWYRVAARAVLWIVFSAALALAATAAQKRRWQ